MKLLGKNRFKKGKKQRDTKISCRSEEQHSKKRKKDTVMVFAFPYSISKSLPNYETRSRV